MSLKKWKYVAFLAWATAGVIYGTSRLLPDQQIAKPDLPAVEKPEVTHARAAAHAGMSHFISHHLSNNEVGSGILVPETSMDLNSSYEVEVLHNDSEKIIIMSRGRYTAPNNTTYEYPIKVVFNPKSD